MKGCKDRVQTIGKVANQRDAPHQFRKQKGATAKALP